jgi:hypothetical protein
MRSVVKVARLAIDNNMRARARLVEVVCRQEETYDVLAGTTMVEDKVCAPQLEAAVAVVLGLMADQINITVTPVSQKEVDLHFEVCTSGCCQRSWVQHRRSNDRSGAPPSGRRRLLPPVGDCGRGGAGRGTGAPP